ncbi:glycerophosphoryl diester phosphodiesterase membrane domain-containing protein [Desulfuribacillus alkaliarsenatis]|uniref:Glycerophosphodiester phosphodiesterase n=1 Tax=Desulfuribacillus alkaliarsenatis TaxID=766136 RepID=A0A1E5G319_9FIRM|nr:glycerophosphoryl diester phosphodiesterase membrane domain-containing protein [Desulfuribacillus alkaliarsenatis]OEF97374.1 glycerophosphodiester phosphodiesterase [Desulfuribacillus alkaliarsenatis]
MLSLLASSYKDFKYTYKKYIVFEFIYLLLTSFLFVPLIAYIFNRALIAMGSSSLLNSDVFKIVLSIEGVIGLLVIGLIAVTVIFIEFGVLIVIANQQYLKKSVSIIEAVITTVKYIPKILRISVLQLILFLVILIPFIDLSLSPTLMEGIEMPAFLMDQIVDSYLLLSLYVVGFILIIYFFIRWLFTLHFIIIENKSTVDAIKASHKLTRSNKTRILFALLALNVIISALGILLIAVLSFAPSLIGVIDRNYFIENYLITLSSFLTFILALLLTPINIIVITRLFYQAKTINQAPMIYSSVQTYESTRLANMEERMFRFFGKRKQLLIFIVIFNLVGTFVLNYHVSSDVINLGRSVEIAAHRGDPINAPENSISSIRAALDQDVDFVEIDVQITRDGVVVLHHDYTLTRVAGVPYRVADLTYEQLTRLEVGSWFSQEFSGEKIPTLEEAILEVKGKAKLIVDVKPYGPNRALAEGIVEQIERHNMVGEAYVQSFQYEVLQHVRSLNQDIIVGQIMFFAIGNLSALDVDYYAIEQSMLSNQFVKNARRDGRDIWVWTVNHEQDIKEVLRYDIDGIITDYPERVRALIEPNI